MSNLRFCYTNHIEAGGTNLLNGPSVVLGNINSCTFGLATITRVSGSYITDGVKVGSLLSGGIAARFPASTRVKAVSALSLTMGTPGGADVNATSTGSNESATFSPNQAFIEAAGFPMTNVKDPDRGTLWDCGASPPGTIILEWDFGGPKSVTFAALIALRAHGVAGGIDGMDIDSASAYGTWTPRGTVSVNDPQRDRDAYATFGSASARFWRTTVYFSARADLGGIWLGVIDQDLGFAYPANMAIDRLFPASRVTTPAGFPHTTREGSPGHLIKLPIAGLSLTKRQQIFAALDNAAYNDLVNLPTYRNPIMLTDEDLIFEVRLAADRLGYLKRFLNLEAMPEVELEGLQ